MQEFAHKSILDAVVVKREPIIFWMKVLLFCLAWICAVIAMMGPKGNERYAAGSNSGQKVDAKSTHKTVLRKKAHEIIFLVDASASMKISDVSGKSRLEASKEIVDDVIRNLKGENVSLYAFTSVTIQIIPSTLDYLFTRLMLRQIEINEGETEGTDIKQALEFLKNQNLSQSKDKTTTLIVLSDGGDTSLEGLTGDAKNQKIIEIVSPMADVQKLNTRIYTVGLGSTQGSKIPDVMFKGQPVTSSVEGQLLRKLSAAGHGDYFGVVELTPFQISRKLNQEIARNESFVDVSADIPEANDREMTRTYDLYFQYPLALAIMALIGCLLIPNTQKKITRGT